MPKSVKVCKVNYEDMQGLIIVEAAVFFVVLQVGIYILTVSIAFTSTDLCSLLVKR